MYVDATVMLPISPVLANGVYNITIPIPDDDIALEYNDNRTLRYESEVAGLNEAEEEFIRDTAILRIIDNDGKVIITHAIYSPPYTVLNVSFSASFYDIEEDNSNGQPVTVRYGKTEKSFIIVLKPAVSNIDFPSDMKATPGRDFNQKPISVPIPNNVYEGTMTYNISLTDIIINDNTVDTKWEHFVMIAEFHPNILNGTACFETKEAGCLYSTSIDIFIRDTDGECAIILCLNLAGQTNNYTFSYIFTKTSQVCKPFQCYN